MLFIAGDAEKRGARTNGTGPNERLLRGKWARRMFRLWRGKSLRCGAEPTPGVSFATPRTEEDE